MLVNNAGIWGDYEVRPLLDVEPDYWDFVMGVNVRGPLLCSRAVAPTMVSQGRGRIINISSIGAYMVSGVYGVSKLALNQLTFALAKELGTAGVTVNAVAPGPIDNEASRKQVPDAAMDRLRDGTMVKRLGDADDIYGMIAYLASDDAAWVTGQTYMVNGGFSSRLYPEPNDDENDRRPGRGGGARGARRRARVRHRQRAQPADRRRHRPRRHDHG